MSATDPDPHDGVPASSDSMMAAEHARARAKYILSLSGQGTPASPLTGSVSGSQITGAKGIDLNAKMPIVLAGDDGSLSRMAALEVAEAHVAQLEARVNDRGYPKYQMSLSQRTMHVLAYADWLCGGEPPKDLK